MLPTPWFHVAPSLRARVPPRLVAHLARRTRRTAQLLGLSPDELRGLGLRIVDDAEMARLHLAFMGEAGPTDVLSFSPDQHPLDGRVDAEPEPLQLAVPGVLGDVVIDWDAVVRQARGHAPRARLDEATVLVVHGVVHLLGHDHRNRREGRRMHRIEERVLRVLRVPDPPRPYAPRGRVAEVGP